MSTPAPKPSGGAATKSPSSNASSALAPRPLRVARVVRETDDAVSLHLEDPQGQKFAFLPGQFMTLVFTLEGEQVRRAYSIASSALDGDRIVVATKRVLGGRVSNHINENVKEGDTIHVLGPSGAFIATPSATHARHAILIAGGSGITPMMSIARTLLAVESGTYVSLVYGNRGHADIIFRAAIDELVTAYGERFRVHHVLASPEDGFPAASGLLDRSVTEALLAKLDAPAQLPCEYFICGPEGMMAEARAALVARAVPPEMIREERFNQPHLRSNSKDGLPASATTRAACVITLRMGAGARVREVTVPPDRTVLEAGLDAGLDLPFSCAMGGCGACRIKLVSGDVEMEQPNCLTDSERTEGYVLACVSHPTEPSVFEVGE